MDQQQLLLTIDKLANALASQQSWLPFAVQAVLMVVIGAASAYAGAYLAARGKNAAIRKDFSEISSQLDKTVTITESIKGEITRSLELDTLRRASLERIMEMILEGDSSMDEWWRSASSGGNPSGSPHPQLFKIEALVAIYAPAAKRVFSDYYGTTVQWIREGLVMQGHYLDLGGRPLDEGLLAARRELQTTAQKYGQNNLERLIAVRRSLVNAIVGEITALMTKNDQHLGGA
ncbi:hypothetical protein ACL598_18825 [Bordetella bronchialis]|uniref:hypothetical protein n=1 Tax=Bordetella bronchialis TaxID=463025 RepID=UPI003D07131C